MGHGNREKRRIRATAAPIDGLNPDDPGIGLLADAVARVPAREILLVCCGDVPGVGPPATRLILDVREREGSTAQVVPLTEDRDEAPRFGHAIVWPRPHLGKDFSLFCLAKGALALRAGGTLWCAARKAKGAQSLTDAMGALMGEVDVVGRSKGYRLLRSRRGAGFDQARAAALVATRYAIEDEALPGLRLQSAPGVFSRRALDAGTRQLIEHTAGMELTPEAVLDLGCGVGPLSLWAARRWPRARVLAVDSNLRAVELTRANARAAGLHDRVTVLASDGMPAGSDPGLELDRGDIELALVNPPTHADPDTLTRLAEDLRGWLAPAPRGRALLVVSRAGRMSEVLARTGASVEAYPHPRYTVLEAHWSGPG